MIIDMIDDIHLKAELNEDDMIAFEVNLEAFSEKSERVRAVLKSILKNAYEQTGFDIFSSQLLIEVFPITSNGCVMLFTRLTKKRKFRVKLKNTAVSKAFVFKNIDDLFSFCKNAEKEKFLFKTTLYLYNGEYYLNIFSENGFSEKCLLMLSEFGSKKSAVSPAFLLEHGKTLIENGVIDFLAKL